MKFRRLHSWKISYKEAVRIQDRLSPLLIISEPPDSIDLVAGIDLAFSRTTGYFWAGAVVMRFPELELLESAWVRGRTDFPYIPGLLSFREIPLALRALRRLKACPDLFMCDGQGIAHPRRLGLASHLGLILDRPTIGCAKSRLVGEYSEVGEKKGSFSELRYRDEIVGAVLRTRTGVKPVFVSPGHRTDIGTSVSMVLACCTGFRIPEPVRQAHILVNRLRRMEEGG